MIADDALKDLKETRVFFPLGNGMYGGIRQATEYNEAVCESLVARGAAKWVKPEWHKTRHLEIRG